VTFFGDGVGRVRSEPDGIECDASGCRGAFDDGVPVRLHAVPAPPTLFRGWGGSCQLMNAVTDPCDVDFSSPPNITADFDVTRFTFLPIPDGAGKILISELNQSCTAQCTLLFSPDATTATAIALPSETTLFDRWINQCEGSISDTCQVSLNDNGLAVALFQPRPRIILNVPAGLRIEVTPSSTTCGDFASTESCVVHFDPDTVVQLSVSSSALQFVRWNECPEPTDETDVTCEFTIRAGDSFLIEPVVMTVNPA
jgi:hypothetical protein